jgi:hypothetical protein
LRSKRRQTREPGTQQPKCEAAKREKLPLR